MPTRGEVSTAHGQLKDGDLHRFTFLSHTLALSSHTHTHTHALSHTHTHTHPHTQGVSTAVGQLAGGDAHMFTSSEAWLTYLLVASAVVSIVGQVHFLNKAMMVGCVRGV